MSARPAVTEVDLVVVGLGPGGEALATGAAKAGLEVVAVDKHLVGGECPYHGCIPTKMMVRGSDLVAEVRRAPRVAGRGHRRVLLEDAVDDRALPDDRRVLVDGVVRVEVGHLGSGVAREDQRPVDLVGRVAAQVPRHRLEPRERVDRAPLLGLVVQAVRVEHGVFRRDLARRSGLQVGVDPVGVRLQRGSGLGTHQGELLLGDPPPAQRPRVRVALDGRLPEQLREPARRLVPAHVHLEEPLLRLHVALGPHQVLHGVAVELRDAVVVAHDVVAPLEPREVGLPGGLREWCAHQLDHGDRAGQEHQDEARRGVHREARETRPGAEPLPRTDARTGRGRARCAVRCAGRHGRRHGLDIVPCRMIGTR